jgi:superfamily II DNA or RNA helicase
MMSSVRENLSIPPWTRPLRAWQASANLSWAQREPESDLWVATPGAGKTVAAGRLAHALLRQGDIAQAIIVVPRDHLKAQFSRGLAEFGIHLDYEFSNGLPVLSRDMHGVVVTYQQIAAEPAIYDRLVRLRQTLVIMDEIHHAGDGASWAEALRGAFEKAKYRLCLSGTPFRSDGKMIPFVTYDSRGVCQPGFNYGYENALADGVCRQVVFPIVQSELSWISRDGEKMNATFEQRIAKDKQSERLRTHLLHDSFTGVLQAANETLMRVRSEGHRDAGGLIVCMNQAHAKQMVSQVRETLGFSPRLIVSDDPESSRMIDGFAKSAEPWLVAVHMVSEGVDIPRLRVGVFASNVRTELYFRQFVGRFVRLRPGMSRSQRAYVYIPGDPKLVAFAREIRQEVQSAVKRPQDEVEDLAAAQERGRAERSESLYKALGSNIILGGTLHGDLPLMSGVPDFADPPAAAPAPEPSDPEPIARGEAKIVERAKIKSLVRTTTARFKVEPAKVYATLKKRCGGRDIAESTLFDLQARVKQLNRWLEKGYYDGFK